MTFEAPSDLETWSNAALEEHVFSMHALSNAAHASLLEAVEVLGKRKAFSACGHRSMSEWLVARLSLSHAVATSWVEVAGALEDLPQVAKVYEEGKLSFDQLKPLTEVADAKDDASLAEEAPSCSVRHLEGLAREKRKVTREEAARDHRSRSLRLWWKDRMLHLAGELPDTDGALVEKAIRRLADTASADPVSGRYEPFGARCADALVQMSSGSLEADNDVERTTVVVHVQETPGATAPLQTRPPGQNGTGSSISARIEEGPVIADETLRRLLCGCRIQAVEEDESGKVKGLGQMQRTASPWQR
ncbi:MAG TPA: DUF222 domain-containing protein, partial [Acidimicrobiales bacterium]|nr:DUF222 domain-containing protein [Acidimicrobiales bacterium]